MEAPMSKQRVLESWNAQNPALVKALRANGTLKERLEESHESASKVLANNLHNGLSLGSALELALDSVSLPLPSET